MLFFAFGNAKSRVFIGVVLGQLRASKTVFFYFTEKIIVIATGGRLILRRDATLPRNHICDLQFFGGILVPE